MRKLTTYAIVFLLLLSACKKKYIATATQDSLQGEWKLLEVKDKNTRTIFAKPAGALKDIIINFKANSFSGHTLRNDIENGGYTLQNRSELKFESFSMTKVAEDEWGGMFVTVLQSCYLQSVFPCIGSKISFQNDKLIIESQLRYDLTLVRN